MDERVAETGGRREGLQYNVDDELVPADAASVDVRDRGFRYGDAVVEPMRAYGGRIFAWPAHFTRLRRGVEALAIRPPVTERELRGRVRETLRANDLLDAFVRVSVTGGVDAGGQNPNRSTDPTVVVTVAPTPRGGTEGRRSWGSPATLETVAVRRVPNGSVPSHVLSHNRLAGVLGFLDADDFVDDVILLDRRGRPTQTATASLFFVRDGTLATPSTGLSVHPGVRRWLTLEIADELDVPTETERYDLGALASADEVFLANTRWETRPVQSIDGARYPEAGPVATAIGEALDRLVEERHY
ncbi:MAG: aminotransferase class IV [Halanaeroarchaeum sp.]